MGDASGGRFCEIGWVEEHAQLNTARDILSGANSAICGQISRAVFRQGASQRLECSGGTMSSRMLGGLPL